MRAEALNRVKLVFTLFDADGNGYLEPEDFALMADRVVLAAPDAGGGAEEALREAFQQWWLFLLGELDTDRDGRISLQEFTAGVLSPERFREALTAFATSLATLGDPDGDGLVERPVFEALMTAIGFERANIHALFDAFGPTDDDRIETGTWITGIQEFYSPDHAGIPGDRLVGDPVP
ncbi:EF-hand domain-containing protein [Streptomyces sp. NPDC059853]|uniref:EF-hand domain-containing protein n=1 Tax=Streptomyces sp. NPDC059853 TaxID=3346973 RepID=UPI00364FBF4C